MVFWASLFTIIGVGSALFFWFYDRLKERKSQTTSIVNSLFEEIKHNIVLRKKFCNLEPEENDFKILVGLLNSLGPNDKYPSPVGLDKELNKALIKNTFRKGNPPNISAHQILITMHKDGVQNALLGGLGAIRLPRRVFLNLGELLYAINIDRDYCRGFNDVSLREGTPDFVVHLNAKEVYDSYMQWVHYRLWFTLLDMAKNIKTRKFVDKTFVENLKGKLERYKNVRVNPVTLEIKD